ncbi:MAG: hypothetical protein ACYSU0_04715 [Planctomycetota bacterium]|jgi:hypothetical protein
MRHRHISLGLLASALLCFVVSLLAPFTNAAAGANVVIPGWLFLGWGPEMIRSELSYGNPAIGLTLLIVYLGNIEVAASVFLHRSRLLTLAVICASPVVAIAGVCLFIVNLRLGQAPWGNLVFVAAIGLLGLRAGFMRLAREPGDAERQLTTSDN